MSEYKVLNNYLIFKQLHMDSCGVNYRGADIKDNKPVQHRLITEVFPFFTADENTWKRITILLEGVKKSNITHLYSPDRIVRSKDATFLVFPYMKGKTMEQIMEDSKSRDVPVNFDLAFSMIMSIADQLDVGSTIVVSGKKSFHGFLTPDNIFVDYDGNIFLKNYGITPYLDQNDEIFREVEMKYGAMLAPEFLRGEKTTAQTDIYHLGYMIYRMLTGQYFSYSPGEEFDAKFSNLSFSNFMPTTDTDFITHLINFFKKTLNPDPMRRFTNIRELKDYISNYFSIEELSSVTFNLSYFMNSLYAREMEQEEKEMAAELEYDIPEPKEEEPVPGEAQVQESEIVEQILSGLDSQGKSGSKLLVPLIVVILVVAAVAGYFFVSQSKQSKQEQQQAQLALKQELEQFKKKLENDYQSKLNAIEQQTALTEEEQKKKEAEIEKLKNWREAQQRKEQERLKAIDDAKKEQEDQAQKVKLEAERKKQEEADLIAREKAEALKKEQARNKMIREMEDKIAKGEPVAIEQVTRKPKKISGDNPMRSRDLKRQFRGQNVTVVARLLIDDMGTVSMVRFKGNVAAMAKMELTQILATWKYEPALWQNKKVKVWLEVPVNLNFAK